MEIREEIYKRLGALGIAYRVERHPPAHTMEDLREAEARLGAVIPKNLFLTPRNQSAYYLCLVMPRTQFRTADISKQIGSSRLSFGSAEALDRYLNTHPGAVSPMGLLFESAREIALLADARLRAEPFLGFHPNDNTQTLAMRGEDFFDVFLPAVGHNVTWVNPG